VRSGVVPAAWAAGFVLILAGCTQTNQTATTSPETTPSSIATTPGSVPTPTDTPIAATSPPAKASPSPAKLIIKTLPFHLGEVGVTYGTVTVVAAGGVKPYKWSISGGALPPGVTLSSSGKATGKPTTTGTFSFVVRVDDSAGGAAGAPSSILVFRQLAFSQTTITCGNSPSSCALSIPYTGGLPGDKPIVKILKVSGGSISTRDVTGACTNAVPTSSAPPGMTTSASGGAMLLSAAPTSAWCYYTATIVFELVDRSPCGAGLLCASRNTLSVYFNI
jgi:hypothetical protein